MDSGSRRREWGGLLIERPIKELDDMSWYRLIYYDAIFSSINALLEFLSACAIPLRPHCLELDAKLIRDAVDHFVHFPIPLSHPAGPFGDALISLFPSLFLSLRGVS